MTGDKDTRLPLPLFVTGQVVATPGALRLLGELHTNPMDLLARHTFGDWSDMCPEDQQANRLAVEQGQRILSSYRVGQGASAATIWVITEADRSSTCVLRPVDY